MADEEMVDTFFLDDQEPPGTDIAEEVPQPKETAKEKRLRIGRWQPRGLAITLTLEVRWALTQYRVTDYDSDAHAHPHCRVAAQ